MGNNCSDQKYTPYDDKGYVMTNLLNSCDDQIIESRHLCKVDYFGTSNNDAFIEYCNKISPGSNEWEFSGKGSSCKKSSCRNNQECYSAGCCNGCCQDAVNGNRARCRRKAYEGDELVCCLTDYIGCNNGKELSVKTGDPGIFEERGDLTDTGCFESGARNKTCSPASRDMTSTLCQEKLEKFCNVYNEEVIEDGDKWYDRWISNKEYIINKKQIEDYYKYYPENTVYERKVKKPCQQFLFRNMLNGNIKNNCSDNPLKNRLQAGMENPNGYIIAKRVFGSFLDRYFDEYGGNFIKINENGESKKDTEPPILKNYVKEMCKNYPGLCVDKVKDMCRDKSMQDLIDFPYLATWCGCYLPDDQYDEYINLFQINKECITFCNNPNAFPLLADDGINILTCQTNICFMDKFYIDYINSEISDTNINQICNSCGNSLVESYSNIDQTDSIYNKQKTKGQISHQSSTSLNSQSYYGQATNKCSCVLYGANLGIKDSNVNNINLSQNCGNAECYTKVNFGNGDVLVPYSCGSQANSINSEINGTTEDDLLSSQEYEYKNLKTFIINVCILSFFLIIFFILFGYVKYRDAKTNYPAKDKNKNNKTRASKDFNK